MLVRYTLIEEGPGPSELMVGVQTVEGRQEEIIVSNHSVCGNLLDVGNPLQSDSAKVLVELPRESLAGRWRIWVPASETVPHRQAAE